MRRRVVVTGLGMVTAIGNNAQDTWNSLVTGISGVRKIEDFPVDNLPCKIAASVRYKSEIDPNGFDPLLYVEPKDLRKMGHFILLGIAAADEAVRDAGWLPELEHDREQTAVVVGSGVGGLPVIEETAVKLKDFGFKKVSPFFIPSTLSNLLPGNISIRYNYYGPNLAVTTACASGAHAVGEGAAMIRAGRANVVIAGGAEGVVSPIAVAGFAAGRALSTKFNDTPHLASRPWDRDRDGFVIGEGAGMLVLEDYDHALKRGAKIYAELLGYGASGDAFHITAPPSDGSGARRSMSAALRDAGIEADDIDYINAHGTSTPVGDEAELEAVMGLFNLDNRKRKLYMSSIKSSIGHLLGAAGGVEAVVSVMALQKKALPPTLNLHNPIVSHEKLDLVPNVAKEVDVRVILSNSFGFGGTNASLIFAKHG